MIIEIKDETMEYKTLSFLVWCVVEQDRTRPLEVYVVIYVGQRRPTQEAED